MSVIVPKWGLNQLNLHDLGHTIQLAGAIYADSEVVYICMLPDEPWEGRQPRLLELDQDDWKKVLHQTDLLETEVLTQAKDGTIAKAIIRKSTRQIEQGVSWAVYRRDRFRCRYCGADEVPLTVDHLIVWEEGGPSIESNLVACCRKCNKARGSMPYEEWLGSPYYKKVSQNLQPNFKRDNERILENNALSEIPLRHHIKSR